VDLNRRQWHYSHLNNPRRRWAAGCFEFHYALVPLKPWTLFHSQHFEPEGWYNPCIPSRFISSDAGSFWIFVAGNWTTAETAHGLYGLRMIPVTLEEQV
jgi:hypothetical protein